MAARAGPGAGAPAAAAAASIGGAPATSSSFSRHQQQQQQERVGPSRMVDRAEYVRLLQQALRGLGFGGSADALERESVRLSLRDVEGEMVVVAFAAGGGGAV